MIRLFKDILISYANYQKFKHPMWVCIIAKNFNFQRTLVDKSV